MGRSSYEGRLEAGVWQQKQLKVPLGRDAVVVAGGLSM